MMRRASPTSSRAAAACCVSRRRRWPRSSADWARRSPSAVELIRRSQGRVIVAGVGKSGLIGRKIAATLTSTGTPATFLHPVESVHGDLGIVGPDDVAILLSKSGETDELLPLLEQLERFGVQHHRDHRERAVVARAQRGCLARCVGARGGVSARPRADDEHDRGARAGRRARRRAPGGARASAARTSRDCIPAGALGRRLLTRVSRRHADRRAAGARPPTTRCVEAVVLLAERRGIVVVVDGNHVRRRVHRRRPDATAWSARSSCSRSGCAT